MLSKRWFYILSLISIWLLLAKPVLALDKVELYPNWQPQFEFAGYYAAIEQGYYAANGIEVEIIPYDSSRNITQTVLAETGRYGVDYNRIVLSYMQGAPVVMLANIFKVSPHVLISQPSIRSPAELKGKRVMAATGELDTAGMATMLRQFYLTADSYQLVPHTFDIEDFAQGKVDAMTVYLTNQVYELSQRGAQYNIHDPNKYAGLLYSDNLYTSAKETEEYPERTRRFLQATLKGWQYALDHSEELVALIKEKYGSKKTLDALRFEAEKSRLSILPTVYPLGSVDIDRLKQLAAIYIELGMTITRTQLSDFVYQQSPTALPSLTSDEKAYLSTHPTLLVNNEANRPPINYNVDGKPSGYSVDFITLVAKKLGVGVDFVMGHDADTFLSMLQTKDVDVLLNFEETAKRNKQLLFTQPYLSMSSGIYVKEGANDDAVHGINDLKGKRLAVPNGSYLDELLKSYYPEIEIRYFPDVMSALEAVSVGEVDAVIGRTGILNFLIEEQFINNVHLVSVINDERFNIPMRLAVSKDKAVLRGVLTKAMQSLTEEELAQLRRKWGQLRPDLSKRLSPEEHDYIRAKQHISLCIDPDWMPVESFDATGRFVGMSADYYHLFEAYMGIPFKVMKTQTWNESLALAREQRCDLVSLLSKTDSRNEYLNFTTQLMRLPYVVATRKEELFIESTSQLLDKKIGIVKGYSIYEKLMKRYPEGRWIEVKNITEGLLKVQSGELYGFIDAVPTIGYSISEMGMQDLKISGRIDEETRDLSIGVNKYDPVLLSIMQKAVNSLTEEDHQRIRAKWSPLQYESKVNYSLAWWVLSVSVIVIGLLAYRQHMLKRYHRIMELAYAEKQDAHLKLLSKSAELERLSTTDMLTGVYNRLKMNHLVDTELSRVKRYGGTFALIMIDLDHFKLVNDNFGHPVGDQVLIKMTQVINRELRASDALGRWGGEEFMLLCPGTTFDGALRYAEKLRNALSETVFAVVGHQYASFGVTAFDETDSVDSMLQRVDAALYHAKENGRNRVSGL